MDRRLWQLAQTQAMLCGVMLLLLASCTQRQSDSVATNGQTVTNSDSETDSRPTTGQTTTVASADQSSSSLASDEVTDESGADDPAAADQDASIRLKDVSAASGIDFEHFGGRTDTHYIIETITCGLATFDFDNDGLLDVYLPSGAPLQGAKIDPAPSNRLFKNLGDMKFVDVTRQSGAGDLGFALGVVAGDLDNDGDVDLFVTNYGPSVLLDNQGDGTFERRTLQNDGERIRVGAGACLLDFDGDGDLDLFESRYVDFTFEQKVSRTIFGVPAAPGPKDYNPEPDRLLQNDGAGNLIDVSLEAGIARSSGAGMGVVAFDFDGDFDADIFVCNDSAANSLFESIAPGKFDEIAQLAGVAYGADGGQQASMGVDAADIDHDGDLDLVATNFEDEIPNLYVNSGLGYFDDKGAATGLGKASGNVTWGIGLADLDNDTWDDCFIAAGHLIDGLTTDGVNRFRARNFVLRNLRGKLVADGVGGDAQQSQQVSRGCALDDLDNDGRIDITVLNLDAEPQVIQNVSSNENGFLSLRLVGTDVNRDAVGATVEMVVGQERWVKQQIAGRGYQSHYGTRLHFGLGNAKKIDLLRIHWSKDDVQQWEDLALQGQAVIVQGQSGPPVSLGKPN